LLEPGSGNEHMESTSRMLRWGLVCNGTTLPAWCARCVEALLGVAAAELAVLILDDAPPSSRGKTSVWGIYGDAATEFAEEVVRVIEPDTGGPFPNGVHTLAAAGSVTLIDGKRRIFVDEIFRQETRRYLAKVARLAGRILGPGRSRALRPDALSFS
jgi:hypothetical protein